MPGAKTWVLKPRTFHCFTPNRNKTSERTGRGPGPAGLGKPKLLLPTGQTQAHGWGGRALKVKAMVGGGRRSIWAPAELGPQAGEMTRNLNACVRQRDLKECVGWWSLSSCRNAKGRRLEPMSGTACDVQPNSIENGKP